MKCPYCGYKESKVVDSRPADEGSSIRRRRECLACQRRFTTYEMVESLPMLYPGADMEIILEMMERGMRDADGSRLTTL